MKIPQPLSRFRIMASVFVAASGILLAAGVGRAADDAPRGLDVYLLRHAESMGNVTGDYSEENQRTFSPKGLEQVAGIVEKLKAHHFDHIMVSPTHRTRQTILPYLKAHGLTAEIWPEVEECCCDLRGNASPARVIPQGDPVIIEEDEALYFRIREDGSIRYAPGDDAEGVAQIFKARDEVLKRFGQSGQSVLIVTHSCTGSRIMEALLGIKPAGRFAPANAAVTHLRQETNGVFRLVLFNDEPFEQRYYWKHADGRDALPGRPLRLSLIPRFVAQQSDQEYRVAWRLSDSKRQHVTSGAETFRPAGGSDGEILSIELPTESADYGQMWSLNTRLYSGDKLLHSWQHSILFPSYLSLAGSWKIKDGDEPAWAATDFDDGAWTETLVPGGWEADALPGYDGTAWYRISFSVPDDMRARWGDQPLAVAFGAVDDADETFLNGERIGQSGTFPPEKTTAWDRPRVYEFDSALLSDKNTLAVRVSDWEGGGGVWKGPVAVGPASELKRVTGVE
ncbi:MAG: Histidine phosphatase superfamily (branch 1) [Verrucomicrobia bacterium ADurb.Bin345]|nr:MAG: Histidine phosphatase superfamily (branch 1) [Verrucomicrobia bacterium ADurb.Bin345]